MCKRAPAHVDGEVATLARAATVTQLRRALSSYSFETPLRAEGGQPEEQRRVSFGYTDEGSWSLSALLPADEGALWERALSVAREELFRAGGHDDGLHPQPASVSWADALVAVADRSLAPGASSRPHRDRHLVLLHVETNEGEANGHVHLGPGLPQGLRRFLSCDSRVRPVLEAGGKAVSVGRAFRTVPERTRVVIEDRDRGCRVPGCERSRWLHVHDIDHWEDGGASDTQNLGVPLLATSPTTSSRQARDQGQRRQTGQPHIHRRARTPPGRKWTTDTSAHHRPRGRQTAESRARLVVTPDR